MCIVQLYSRALYLIFVTLHYLPVLIVYFLFLNVLPDDWIDCGLPSENRAPHALSW